MSETPIQPALRSWSEKCFAYLKDAHPSPPDPDGWPRWVRRPGEDYFVLQTTDVPNWGHLVFEEWAALQALVEYEDCLATLRADPEIGPQLGELIGDGLGRHRLDAGRMLPICSLRCSLNAGDQRGT